MDPHLPPMSPSTALPGQQEALPILSAHPRVRISQRASTSCSECSRRKTRCDKEIPCGNCKKRGKAHLCHVVPNVRPKDAEKLRSSISSSVPLDTPPVSNGHGGPSRSTLPTVQQSPTTLDGLAHLAFAEVEDLRSTIEGLRSKVTNLESLLVAAFGRLKQDPEQSGAVESSHQHQHHLKTEQYTPSAPFPTPLPLAHHISYSPSMNGDIYISQESHQHSASVSPALSSFASASTTTYNLPPMDTSRAGAGYQPFGAGLGGGGNERAMAPKVEVTSGEDSLREKEVEASLSLEYMALGRRQASAQTPVSPNVFEASPLPSLVFHSPEAPPHPSSTFPTAASFAAALPSYPETLAIVEHAIEWTGWCHSSVHAPTFRAEVQEFWAHPEENRLEKVNPAWLSLLFAQLCCGVKHMTSEQLGKLGPYGISGDEAKTLAKHYLDAALSSLYHSHFLENHQLYSVQAISVLVVTAQDGAFSNLFPALLSLGVSLALDLGLHRLPSAEAWAASVAGLGAEQKAASLCAYETKKRIFWALTAQDWWQIPYRRTTMIQPTQVTTPLPLNATDEDLLNGDHLINRPPSEFTPVSTLLVAVQIARVIQEVFAHVDSNPTGSTYAYVLELDRQLRNILANVPDWLKSDAHAPNLPPNVAWMRATFAVSSQHKILTLHRNFFRRYEPSRRRALDASRAILRIDVGDTHMWTVPYHISGAASVVCLDLFQRGSPPAVLLEERHEVYNALATLRRLSSFSSIAARGAGLIENLLAEESRLPPIPSPLANGHSHSNGCNDDDRAYKKRRTDGGTALSSFPPHLPPHLSSPASPMRNRASLSNLLVSPEDNSLFAPNGLVGVDGRSISPAGQQHHFDASSFSDFANNGGDSDLFVNEVGQDGGGMRTAPNELGLVDELPLPLSFMSIFLDSGFDPLDGAITTPGSGLPWLDERNGTLGLQE